MPDITLCTGNCPVKEYCYRFTAKPNSYGQTYSSLEAVCLSNNDYKEFIPDEKRIITEDCNNEINYTFHDILLAEIHKLNETN